jgi:hypothetical protein
MNVNLQRVNALLKIDHPLHNTDSIDFVDITYVVYRNGYLYIADKEDKALEISFRNKTEAERYLKSNKDLKLELIEE